MEKKTSTDKIPVVCHKRQRKMTAQEAVIRKRESRRVCEQNRRDRMQTYLSEISARLPVVKSSKKRVTKLAILRLSLSYLRFQHFLEQRQCKIPTLPNAYATAAQDLLLKEMGAFMMVLDVHGTIVHMSETAYAALKVDLTDIIGLSVLNCVHPDDRATVANALTQNSERPEDEEQFSFNCRFSQSLSVSKRKREDDADQKGAIACRVSGITQRTFKTGHANFDSDNSRFFVCVVEPIATPIYKMTEFIDQGSWYCKVGCDGRILDIDVTNSILVCGYMRQEVLGNTYHSYAHPQDLRWMEYSSNFLLRTGSMTNSVMRSRTVDNKYVFVETDSHVEYEEKTKTPTHIIVVSRFVPEDRGMYWIQEQERAMIESSDDLLQTSWSVNTSSTGPRLSIDSGIMSPEASGSSSPHSSINRSGHDFSDEERIEPNKTLDSEPETVTTTGYSQNSLLNDGECSRNSPGNHSDYSQHSPGNHSEHSQNSLLNDSECSQNNPETNSDCSQNSPGTHSDCSQNSPENHGNCSQNSPGRDTANERTENKLSISQCWYQSHGHLRPLGNGRSGPMSWT